MNSVIRHTVGIVDVKFGVNVTVIEPANLYGCDIGDETFIGPFVEIRKGAKIGKRCRINPTRSFAIWSRLGTTASFGAERCLLTISW
jgi:carbonic anhydrase/acetyltransferase-like protein (isoleucine patch superfamily)